MAQTTPAGDFNQRKRSLESCVSRPPASRVIRDRAARVTAHLHGGKTAILVGWGHAHGGVHGRWRGSRAVGAAGRAGVVLGAAPAQADTRVTDGVSLHLVDSHLSGVALDELDETAALSRGDLDVGNLAESLEERAELILGDVARETTNEDSGVVGVGELVHGLGSTVEGHGRATHGRVHASGAGHTHTTTVANTGALVLRGSGGDTHGAVATVDTLHLSKGALLVVLVGETDEPVATGHAADGVGHDLGGLARGEAALEQRNEDVLVNLGAEVTNEDGVLRTTVITAAVREATAGSPVELEDPVGVGHGSAVQRKGLGSGGRGGEVDEAVASIAPRELVADHLDVDLLTHLEPEVADEVLVDPGLKLTHPERGLAIGALLGNGGSVGLTRSGALELSGGGIGLTGHGGVNGGRGASSGGILLRERFEVVERHFVAKIKVRKST
jgi:hypothetical protein